MSTKLDDETLRDILLEHLEMSQVVRSEVNAYERDAALRTYEFLMGCVDRYLAKHIMKRNRHQQISSTVRSDAPKSTPAIKGKGRGSLGGVDPAANAPRWGAEGQPCCACRTNSCQYGGACRCKHVTISQDE